MMKRKFIIIISLISVILGAMLKIMVNKNFATTFLLLIGAIGILFAIIDYLRRELVNK